MIMPSPSATQEKLVAALNPSLRALALRGTFRTYSKNSVIINEGEVGDSLFVLLQGRVKVYSTDEDGDYFAEMWLDGGPRSASVMTLDPSVCSVVGRSALRDHLAEEPEFALEL